MFLTDAQILDCVHRSKKEDAFPSVGIDIEDAPDLTEQIQPASLDVCFDGPLYVMKRPREEDTLDWYINLLEREGDVAERSFVWEQRSELSEGGWVLYPGEFALAQTLEVIRLGSAMTATLHGRSTTGRCGLEVHRTAGWIDPGFHGTITLELSNAGTEPLRLRRGDAIAQLAFAVTHHQVPASEPYSGIYQGQRTTTLPRRGARSRRKDAV